MICCEKIIETPFCPWCGKNWEPEELLEIDIDELMLSVRARRCLKKMGILKVTDLIKVKKSELRQQKNLGESTAIEIEHALEKLNLRLKTEMLRG